MEIILCELTLILFVTYASISSIVTYKVSRRVGGLESRETKREDTR